MSTVASVAKCVIQNGTEWMQHTHVDKCVDVLGLTSVQTALIAALCFVILVRAQLVWPKSTGVLLSLQKFGFIESRIVITHTRNLALLALF
jgi:hypothetical protein